MLFSLFSFGFTHYLGGGGNVMLLFLTRRQIAFEIVCQTHGFHRIFPVLSGWNVFPSFSCGLMRYFYFEVGGGGDTFTSHA